MRDIYIQYPFLGYRRIHKMLIDKGYMHNRKKTQRLMKLAGLEAIYARKNTSISNKAHKKYPYLLKDLAIVRPNQVWAVDITYIKISGGFVYLVCLINIFSRKIMGWDLSLFLETNSCMIAASKALKHGVPEIINSDQGCQFTSEAWCNFWVQHHVSISMDGKGRWVDNVFIERFWRSLKYESIYLNSFDNVDQARQAIATYIDFYNTLRPHQALGYQTPDHVFYSKGAPFAILKTSQPSAVELTKPALS